MKAVTPQRWQASQRLELEFWKHWDEATPYRNLDIPEYWKEELARFGYVREMFDGWRVLDIGCGPYGLIHFVDNAKARIRIDPLLAEYEKKMTLTGPQLSVAGLGEQLPLASKSIDIAICFNALDHMRDPVAALLEMKRVLRPGGKLLLMVHTFPGWTRPFWWIDRLHPHHWTASSFAAQVGEMFDVDWVESSQRRFRVPFWKRILPSSWKYVAGNLVVSSTYVRAHASLL